MYGGIKYMKKIDAHLHLAKVIAGYCTRGESRAAGNGEVAWANGDVYPLLPEGYGEDQFLAETALKIMDRNDVEKAVLMQGSLYGFQNRYYKEVMDRYPNRFLPACTVDPFMREHMKVFRRFFDELGFRVAKFEVSTGGGLMGANDPFCLDGPRFSEIAKVVSDHKGVLVLDVGDPDMDSHQTMAVMRLADKFPDLTVVCCHLLAPNEKYHRVWKAELEILKMPNVYFDISSVPKITEPGQGGHYPYNTASKWIREAMDIAGPDRFMWGTDAPFAATQDTYEHLADYLMEDHGFTEDELKKMYYENAAHVYFGA
jgi:predicted TIM-barrel fold metal-dependent hydrolase